MERPFIHEVPTEVLEQIQKEAMEDLSEYGAARTLIANELARRAVEKARAEVNEVLMDEVIIRGEN